VFKFIDVFLAVISFLEHISTKKLSPIDSPLASMNEAKLPLSNDWSIQTNITDHQHSMMFTDSSLQPTRQATFIGAILAFVFIIIGLIGNIILITAILSMKKLRSNIINIFIVSVREKY
jgi:hypothetical protein